MNIVPQPHPPDLGGVEPTATQPEPQSYSEPPDDDATPPLEPPPRPPSAPPLAAAAPVSAPSPALRSPTSAMTWLASLSGVPPWVLIVLAMTPWGQRQLGIEHEDPAVARAAIVADVRREMGAEIKTGLDGLRAELVRERESHERQHALEEKGVERELGAMREEMRLLRESLQPRRR